MKTITISDETESFINNFVNQLKSQDNRATASPYYYVVRGVKVLSAADDRGCGYRYYDPNENESFTEEQLKEYCKEYDLDFEEHKETIEKYNIQEVDEYVNVFFTYEGYKKHIELNGHNYRHFEKFDSYVMHAFRNPEIDGLMKAVHEIANELQNIEREEV